MAKPQSRKQITPEQLKSIKAYIKRSKATRESQRELSKRIKLPQSTLSEYLKRRKAGTNTEKARVSETKAVKTYKQLRDDEASLGNHLCVTAKKVQEVLVDQTSTSIRYKAVRTLQRRVQGKRSLRDPCCAPHGQRSRDSRLLADLRNHSRR